MPGRPRTMLKRVREFVQMAQNLDDVLEKSIPEQYRQAPARDSKDWIHRNWYWSLWHADWLLDELELLESQIAEKTITSGNKGAPAEKGSGCTSGCEFSTV